MLNNKVRSPASRAQGRKNYYHLNLLSKNGLFAGGMPLRQDLRKKQTNLLFPVTSMCLFIRMTRPFGVNGITLA
jgi:hypothetical protein